MKNKLKISFDFDGTLGFNPTLQRLAETLFDAGNDVWILTARQDDTVYDEFGPDSSVIVGHHGLNMDIRRVAKDIGIEDKILFTGGSLKVDLYLKHNFNMHYDDDPNEVDAINKAGGMAFLVNMREEDMKVYTDMKQFEQEFKDKLDKEFKKE